MIISLRSPKGGQPIREWMLEIKKGVSNVQPADEYKTVVTAESYYCVKLGYLEDGSEALMKETDIWKIYRMLCKHFKKME